MGVLTTCTPGGTGTATFAASRVTSAPRRRASRASATPIRPDDLLPTKRTSSTGSRVPPAVTRTRRPRSDPSAGASSASARETISTGSAMRPIPTSPSASSPLTGPTTCTPRSCSVRRLACVAACSHMPVFIAGATSVGPRCASAASVRRSSASPCARRARVWAVSGATTSRSARCRWGYGSVGCSRRARAKSVSAVTKRSAPRVGSGKTSCPSRTSRRTTSHAL